MTVVYDNPTAQTLVDGGMSTLGGVFLPAHPWATVDRTDPIYRLDLARETGDEGGRHPYGSHHH